MKKRLLAIVCLSCVLALSMCLFGCSSNEESSEPKTANVGDSISVSTDDGDFNVTVEGFETSDDMTSHFAEYDQVDDNKIIGMLLLKVENVSFDDGSTFMPSELKTYVNGEDGVSLSIMNGAYDYGEYEGAAGGTFQCAEGQTKRVAFLYQVDPSMKTAEVNVNGTTVNVDVSEGTRSIG